MCNAAFQAVVLICNVAYPDPERVCEPKGGLAYMRLSK